MTAIDFNSVLKKIAKKIVVVDLDGTILEFDGKRWREENGKYFGPVKRGSRRALQTLKASGYYIIVNTCRAEKKDVANLLRRKKIPFDIVWPQDKPLAMFYVDDHAIRFDGNWDNVLKEINGKRF